MKLEEYPKLLVVTKLVNPIDLSLKNLRESKEQLVEGMHDVLVHGIFVMSVAFMEVMLCDTLQYFLLKFPMQLPNKEFRYAKDEFFTNHFSLLNKSIENYVNSLSYKSFGEFMAIFLRHLSIEWSSFQDDTGKYLTEIKATRNLLLHNNLTMNEQYTASAGTEAREGNGGRIDIDYQYAFTSVERIIEFATIIRDKINEKFRSYTKINANKELWKFMFKSPIMPYDDFWQYDLEKDDIFALKEGKREHSISGSERTMLGLWRSHFTHDGHHIKNFHMRSCDLRNQEKVLFFLSIASDFQFY